VELGDEAFHGSDAVRLPGTGLQRACEDVRSVHILEVTPGGRPLVEGSFRRGENLLRIESTGGQLQLGQAIRFRHDLGGGLSHVLVAAELDVLDRLLRVSAGETRIGDLVELLGCDEARLFIGEDPVEADLHDVDAIVAQQSLCEAQIQMRPPVDQAAHTLVQDVDDGDVWFARPVGEAAWKLGVHDDDDVARVLILLPFHADGADERVETEVVDDATVHEIGR
jgi:hypothetical protein